MKYYYKTTEDQETGPFSLAAMQAFSTDGTITAETQARKEDGDYMAWKELQVVKKNPQSPALELAVSFGKSLLLVLRGFFILPYTIAKQSFQAMADWGRKGELPTEESELPVLTFFLVAMKPPVVLMAIPVGVMFSFAVAAGGRGFNVFALIGMLILTYLFIAVVGLFFELLALSITAVNALVDIRKKTR